MTSLTQEMQQADWRQAHSDDFLYPFFNVCIVASVSAIYHALWSPIVYKITYLSLTHDNLFAQFIKKLCNYDCLKMLDPAYS